MKPLQLAVVGLGRLGTACALALLDETELALAGVVRRPASGRTLPGRLQRWPAVNHVRDLPAVDAALVCVPSELTEGVARELLQARIPVVECAQIDGAARESFYTALDTAALHHRVTAVLGAGFDPGVLPIFTHTFEMLVPRGQTRSHRHPGISLHHTALEHLRGIEAALAGEWRGADGGLQRYVYVQMARGADAERVRADVAADPLYAGETTQVFIVDRLDEVEAEAGQGLVLERLSTPAAGAHASLLLEARFDLHAWAAQVMLDAARRLPALRHGAHRYTLGL